MLCTEPPLLQLLRINPMAATPFVFAVLVHGSCVVSSALKRAAGVHCVTCAGLAKASLSQRSNVDSLTPVCSQTCCKLALCGGSNFATTLSLKACPYRATCFLYCLRPCSFDFYRGDNYSDSGGAAPGIHVQAHVLRSYVEVP